MGSFNRLTFHELSGNVVFRGRRKLVVRDFVYDGDAPDAFFVAGTRPVAPGDRIDPSEPGAFALPVEEDEEKQREWNEDGLAVAYGDPDVPILREFDGHRVSAGKKTIDSSACSSISAPRYRNPCVEIKHSAQKYSTLQSESEYCNSLLKFFCRNYFLGEIMAF